MSQTDPVQDVGGDAAQNSSRDSSQSKEPPSLQELRAAAGAARDSVKELDDELQKMAAGHNAENQHRAKKAQKTKGRVKINAPPEQEKKPKHQPDPELDEDEDDEEIEEEPSKLVPAILGCFQAVGGFIKKIFQFIWGLIMRVFGVLLGLVKLVGRLVCKLAPLLVGVPLYCLVLYLSSEYIVNHFDSAQHLDMGFRLNYLLRCHAFTMIPVLLGKLTKRLPCGYLCGLQKTLCPKTIARTCQSALLHIKHSLLCWPFIAHVFESVPSQSGFLCKQRRRCVI